MGMNTLKKVFIIGMMAVGMASMNFNDANAAMFKEISLNQEQKIEQQATVSQETQMQKLQDMAMETLHGTVTIPEYRIITVAEQFDGSFDKFIPYKDGTSFDHDILVSNVVNMDRESLEQLSYITGKDYRDVLISTKFDQKTPVEHIALYGKILEAKANLIERNFDSEPARDTAYILFVHSVDAKQDITISPELEKRFEYIVGLSFNDINQMTATSSICAKHGLNNDHVYIADLSLDDDNGMSMGM